MTSDDRFERLLADMLVDVAPTREPDRLVPEILRAARRERRRARWLALIKEPPMRIHSHVAVGSPIARVAFVLLVTLLMAVLATGAVVTGASLLPGTTIVVAQDGSGTVPTITEAVAIAKDGQTILVKPGTYLESIAITQDITLRGDGDKGAVVIEFTADGPTHSMDDPTYPMGPTEWVYAYGILFEDADARVENVTVRGRQNAAGSEKPISAVVIDGGGPEVDRLDVVLDGAPYPDYAHIDRSAFQITGGSSATIRDSSWDGFTHIFGVPSSPTFEHNTITAQRIAIWPSGHRPTIRGNTFLEGAGIAFVDQDSSAVVENNDIVGWIGGTVGDGTIIRGNTIRQGGEGGDGRPGSAIAISGSETAIVEDNEIIDSPFGIDISGSAKPRISGNTVRGSTSVAIFVDVGAAPTIDGNVIERNGTGIEIHGSTKTPVVMTGNTFCGNETDLVVPNGSSLTLEGNTLCEVEASTGP